MDNLKCHKIKKLLSRSCNYYHDNRKCRNCKRNFWNRIKKRSEKPAFAK